MVEIGLALVEPFTSQTLAAPLAPGAIVTVTLNASTSTTFPASPLPATDCLYPGALVVVGWHSANAEVVEVQSVTSDSTFMATLVNAHIAGEIVFSATFPTQVPTDPIFTQDEIIGYIAQAQNEFLTKVPMIFEFFENNLIELGQTYQTVPDTAIEMERVAVQSNPPWTMFNIASIVRSASIVTAVLSSTSTADYWTPDLGIQVYGVTDNSFNSASNSLFTLATVSPDGLTLTWPQALASASSSGGYVSRPVLTRLYESAQQQIAMNNPWAFSQSGDPKFWWEDRAGIYGWGVLPVPAGGYYVEILASTRASEALGLLSYFNVPDVFVYAIKWRALAYAWSKDGIQRSPSMQRFAKGKFDFYCMLADRFIRNAVDKVGQAGAAMGGNF